MTLRAFFLLCVAAASTLAWKPAAAAVYGAESITLKNGMVVVVIPNHRAPVVAHMVWYKTGAADDPPGKSGIAHFLEHLMFKGTTRYPGGSVSDLVARNGGQENAFTTHDYTAYFQNIAVDRLPLVMDLESDRMRNLVLDKKNVDTERDVIIEERRMRTDNVPASILDERLEAGLWMTNHYGVPVIGWEQEMRGLTQADALSYYNAHYAPNDAILLVSGDVTMDTVRPLAEKYYGPIPVPAGQPATPTTRSRPTFLYPTADTRVVMADERVQQPQWVRAIIAPSYNVGDRDEVHALEVFAEILGGGSTAKMYRTLVIDQKVAAAFAVSYDGETVSYGTFDISMTPSPGVDPDRAEAAYTAAVKTLLDSGITDADVAQAKARMAARLAFAKDSPISAAHRVGMALASGVALADIENWPDAIAKVTTAQVRAAARKILTQSASATGVLLPAPQQVARSKP